MAAHGHLQRGTEQALRRVAAGFFQNMHIERGALPAGQVDMREGFNVPPPLLRVIERGLDCMRQQPPSLGEVRAVIAACIKEGPASGAA